MSYTRHKPLKQFTIDYVLSNFVIDGVAEKAYSIPVDVEGITYDVYVNSERYRLFKLKGL